MLLPELDADEPPPISKAPLMLALAFPVLNDRSPDTPGVPGLLVDTATLPELVAVPTPNEMVIVLPEAVLPSPPSIVTAPPLVLPSPKARVKHPLLLLDDDPETIDASLPAAPDKSPAVTLDAPPMSVPEPSEIAMLLLRPVADKPLPISKVPLLLTLAVLVLNNRSPNIPAVPALLVDTAMLPELVAVPAPDEMVMEPPEAILPHRQHHQSFLMGAYFQDHTSFEFLCSSDRGKTAAHC